MRKKILVKTVVVLEYTVSLLSFLAVTPCKNLIELINEVCLSSDLADVELFHAFEVQVAAPSSDLPMIGLRVNLISLCQHHDGPDRPIVVVQDHALFRVENSSLALISLHGPLFNAIFTLSVQSAVCLRHQLDLRLGGEIPHVVEDAAAERVRIIADHLVKVAGQVVALWVPHAILIIDENEARRILQRTQNIVLLDIVV